MTGAGNKTGDELSGDLVVASLIHEMRQPLTGLHACLSFLAKDIGAPMTDSKDWHLAQAQLTRLVEICETYEEFLNPGPGPSGGYDPAPIVDWAVNLMSHRLRALGDRFEIEPNAGLPNAAGRPVALRHALTNILKNATEAVDARRDEGRVAVRLRQTESGQVEIRISNNGPEIPRERREQIFAARYTTKGAEGRGLGLFISRIMLERSGGSVRVVERKDPARLPWATVEFCITLPPAGAVDVPAEAPVAAIPSRPATGKATVAGGRRILVIDDEPVILDILQMALGRHGHTVTTAATAARGRQLLASEAYDLLVTDKNLPDGSGVDLVRELRRHHAETAVVMITGFASSESAEQLLRIGIDDYVRKPFDIEDLVHRIEQIFARRKADVELGPGAEVLDNKAVLVVGPLEPFREPLRRALDSLGLEVHDFSDIATALAAEPNMHRVLVSEACCGGELHQLLVNHRAATPRLRLAIVGRHEGLEARINAILLGARTVIRVPLPEETELRNQLREALVRGEE